MRISSKGETDESQTRRRHRCRPRRRPGTYRHIGRDPRHPIHAKLCRTSRYSHLQHWQHRCTGNAPHLLFALVNHHRHNNRDPDIQLDRRDRPAARRRPANSNHLHTNDRSTRFRWPNYLQRHNHTRQGHRAGYPAESRDHWRPESIQLVAKYQWAQLQHRL